MRDLSAYALRRDYLLDEAIQVGKFPPERRAHWEAQYDRDPAGTEQTLAMLATAPAVGFPREGHSRITRGASAARQVRLPVLAETAQEPSEHLRPAAAPPEMTETELSPDLVAQWSRDLFPEAVTQASGRVSRAND